MVPRHPQRGRRYGRGREARAFDDGKACRHRRRRLLPNGAGSDLANRIRPRDCQLHSATSLLAFPLGVECRNAVTRASASGEDGFFVKAVPTLYESTAASQQALFGCCVSATALLEQPGVLCPARVPQVGDHARATVRPP